MILFRPDEDAEAEYVKEFEKASKDFRGQIFFSYTNNKGFVSRVGDLMGFGIKDLPALGIIVPSKMSKYHFPGDVRSMNSE